MTSTFLLECLERLSLAFLVGALFLGAFGFIAGPIWCELSPMEWSQNFLQLAHGQPLL
jgi:hypothetical protein